MIISGKRLISNMGIFNSVVNRKLIRNLKIAALFLKGEAMERTPIRTSNLVNSSDISRTNRLVRGRMSPAYTIFYTAVYAVFVHENLNARHTNGMALFLLRAAMDNKAKLKRILRKGLF